jgi:hypothetical protein
MQRTIYFHITTVILLFSHHVMEDWWFAVGESFSARVQLDNSTIEVRIKQKLK